MQTEFPNNPIKFHVDRVNLWPINFLSACHIGLRGMDVCFFLFFFLRARTKPGAESSAAVRLVLRCIMGQLVGCYGDLAGSVLCV